MSACGYLQDYVSGFLDGAEREAFVQHLASCPACQAHVQLVQEVDDKVKIWADSQVGPIASAARATRLMREAQKKSQRLLARRWVTVSVVAAAVMILGLFFLANRSWLPGASDETAIADLEPWSILVQQHSSISDSPKGKQLAARPNGKLLVRANGDLIGIADDSRIWLNDVNGINRQIKLDRGTVAISAKKRVGDQSLVVLAMGYQVAVVGTRFAVSTTAGGKIVVRVEEGRVVVTSPWGVKTVVSANQQLEATDRAKLAVVTLDPRGKAQLESLLRKESSALPAEKTNLPNTDVAGGETERVDDDQDGHAPTVASSVKPAKISAQPRQKSFDPLAIKRDIVSGNISQAAADLTVHLRTSPGDAAAWMLMADCKRKMGEWTLAVDAYERAIRSAGPAMANRARFLAGVVQQDYLNTPAGAITFFKAYLAQPDDVKPLEAEAGLRLARALCQTGRCNEAQPTLKQIVANHQGTTAAVQASKMLQH